MEYKNVFDKAKRKDVLEIAGEKYFSTYEVARRFGICASTFYALKRRYRLQGTLVGKMKYYGEKELAEVVFNRKFKEEK